MTAPRVFWVDYTPGPVDAAVARMLAERAAQPNAVYVAACTAGEAAERAIVFAAGWGDEHARIGRRHVVAVRDDVGAVKLFDVGIEPVATERT